MYVLFTIRIEIPSRRHPTRFWSKVVFKYLITLENDVAKSYETGLPGKWCFT